MRTSANREIDKRFTFDIIPLNSSEEDIVGRVGRHSAYKSFVLNMAAGSMRLFVVDCARTCEFSHGYKQLPAAKCCKGIHPKPFVCSIVIA